MTSNVKNINTLYIDERLIRGGSFLCYASYCASYRVSSRMATHPSTSLMHSSAFVLNNRSATENYEIFYNYISSRYDYPEDVLVSNMPGLELVIQETIPGLYTMKSMGFVNSFAMRYTLTFTTTNGSIECRIATVQMENPVTMSQNIEKEWNGAEGLYLHRKNGKPKKTMLGITDVKIENHFNAILTCL